MKNRKELESDSKKLSSAITTGIVGMLVGCLFIFGFSTPELNEEPEGLLVDFGTDLTGFGLTEPDNNTASGGAVAVQPDEQESITQDTEESIVVTDKKQVTKPKVNPVATTTSTKTTTTSQVNKDELFDPSKINTKGDKGASEGTSTKGGNQGSLDGHPDGNQGTGGGIGDNNGSYGISLSGRTKVISPSLSVAHNEVGDIKIKITVDRNGKVIKADYERSGSTITDSYLITQAKNAALKTTFNADKNASETQTGYITFHFKLN